MEYSASMVSCLFWLQESRKTAQLMSQGLSVSQIRSVAVKENIYQVRTAERAIRIAGATYKRLHALPKDLLQYFISADLTAARLILLIAIMQTDLLFYEFMHTVFRQAVVLGESILPERAVHVFFDAKGAESTEVASWTEQAIKKLKQVYIKTLVESGLLSCAKERKMIAPMIDYRLQNLLRVGGLLPYLSALTGEDYDG